MQTFLVGGAVRDTILGRKVKDMDWVVRGSTPEEMLAAGFKQVGADFPVFLHPSTGDEYALARTERKTRPGYHGFEVDFDPTVTIVDDLARRDLTINAMALDSSASFITSTNVKGLIDPFGGLGDLEKKLLRPVGPAFAEDPVRVLRAFRFLARFGPEWTVHESVNEMAMEMLANGEFDAVSHERFLTEFMKAMEEPHWELFFSPTVRAVLLRVFGLGRQAFPPLKRCGGEGNLEQNFCSLFANKEAVDTLYTMWTTGAMRKRYKFFVCREAFRAGDPRGLLKLAAQDMENLTTWLDAVGEHHLNHRLHCAMSNFRFEHFNSGDLTPQEVREAMEAARVEFMEG